MKKFFPYILILIILVGIFSPITKVWAEDPIASGNCELYYNIVGSGQHYNDPGVVTGWTKEKCNSSPFTGQWVDFKNSNDPTDPTIYHVCYVNDFLVQELRTKKSDSDDTIVDKRYHCRQLFKRWVTITTPTKLDLTYHLLAPLPCDNKDEGCVNGTLQSFNPVDTNNLSKYLNLMIKIFIGLCAVLAVIMIVMGGIEYMTSELISNKEAGKERITHAIFGLLLALGAWTILYQINPNLLNADLKNLVEQKVEVTLQDETETAADAVTTSEVFTGPTAKCPEGIKQSASGIYVCARIADNLDKMISAAKSAGLSITGGGYRSQNAQIALRQKNCNGDTTNANAKCNPPTALPGSSRHNNGLAVDFKCDGQLIQTTDNKCFIWLQNNAGIAGLQNLASEPWHWSTDGR
jgi:hypothetical protein